MWLNNHLLCKIMDRELCVLIYSEFSTASKRLMEYIQSLPYDLAAITGMSFFAADTRESRDKLKTLSITTVPCIFVKYFDGKTTLYTEDNVYAFINAISSSMSNREPDKVPEILPEIDIDADVPVVTTKVINRGDVMAAAMAMQKGREANEKLEKMPIPGIPLAGIQPPLSVPTKPLAKKTKLI